MATLASDWLRYLRFLFWRHLTESNEICQEARSQSPLPSLCFSGHSEKQDGRPGLLLAETFFSFPLKPLNGIQPYLTGVIFQFPLPSLCFSGRLEKQNGHPGLWLTETFSTSFLKLLNGIQWNLTGSKISMSSIKFVFSGLISIQKWPPWLIHQKGGTLYSGAHYMFVCGPLGLLFILFASLQGSKKR